MGLQSHQNITYRASILLLGCTLRTTTLYAVLRHVLLKLTCVYLTCHFATASDTLPFSSLQDIAYLRSQLPNVFRVHYAKDPVFNHLGFLGDTNAHREIYEPILEDILEILDITDKENQLHSS